MSTDDALHQTGMGEVIDPSCLAVTLTGGIHHREVARRAARGESPLEGREQCLRNGCADESTGRDGSSGFDERNCFIR